MRLTPNRFRRSVRSSPAEVVLSRQPESSGAAVRVVQASRTHRMGDERVTALDGVSVDFIRGQFTAVMGPSGSGKSTLLQCSSGLDRLDAGEAFLDGTALGPLSEKQRTILRRTTVGFVFQDYNLVDSLTALQNVELPLVLTGRRPERRSCLASLERVGLGDRAGHLPAQLSGGQRQRVAIARALVCDPAVVFADEPTGALDTQGSLVVLGLLRRIVDEAGLTVVMVTHDPSAAAFADRVIFLRDGALAGDVSCSVLGGDHAQVAAGIAAHMAVLGA